MAENSAQGEKGAFAEIDQRLGAMHGYAPTSEFEDVVMAYRLECARLGIDDVTAQHVAKMWRMLFAQQQRVEDKLNVLAVALDALIRAMKAGAIGKWS